MHRLLSIAGVLLAGVGLSAAGCTRSKLSLDAAAAAKPRIVGRFLNEPSGAQRIAWTGTQVIAAFTGSSIAVKLEDVPPPEGPLGNVYDAIIDNRPPRVVAMHPEQYLYPLAEGLGPGTHTVTLIKRTEAHVGETRFAGFVLAPGGHLLPPPPPLPHHIEIIGDSISAGYGNEGHDATCHFSPLTENGDLAYGPIAARALGAEVSIIARSGHGLIRNRDNTTDNLLPELYQRTVPSDPHTPWQAHGDGPDVVVINLGTNDFAPGLPDLGHFEAAYLRLIRDVRHNAPRAHIFVALGPMLSDAFPADESHLSIARTLHRSIVEQLTAQGDERVALIEFPTQDGSRGFGCDWHPSLATHAAMGAQLAKAIREVLHW
jgi:lysophospholipase L1-like esterase